MQSKSLFGRFRWQDAFVLVIILAYLLLQQDLVSKFLQLPSPLYGGDYYYQLGGVNHIRYGGNPLGGTNFLEGGPGYLPVYPFLVAVFANISGLGSIPAMLNFSQILLAASMAIVYLFLARLFESRTLALLGVLLYLPITSFPVLKYTEFGYAIIAPLFFWALLNFVRRNDVKNSVLLGLAYGIGGLTHTVLFVYLTLILAIFFLYFGFFQYLSVNKGRLVFIREELAHALRDFFRLAVLAFLVGFAIAQLYWFEPIFVYHGKTINNMNLWATADYAKPEVQMSFFFGTLKGLFFNFSDVYSVLRLAGLAFLLLLGNRYVREAKFVGLMLVAYLAGVLHYLVTVPLLGTHFIPNYMSYLGTLSPVILSLFSIKMLSRIKGLSRYVPFFMGGLLIFAFYGMYGAYQNRQEDRWVLAGMSELPPNVQAARGWVLSNTNVNDVVLTTNELGFALNGVTGRKLVTSRKSQNSAFIDIDQRTADAAVILYGNNDTLRKELIEKYKVKYVYWDYYWIQSEYYFDDGGRIVGTFDPLLVYDSEKYRDYFEGNNVTYFKMHTWVDPAIKSEEVRQFDLLFVLPKQWNWQHPWSDDLDPYLKEVWTYEQDGQVLSRIYEVRA